MNIHFTDKDLFEKLKLATIAKVRVGSHLYGNNNANSDEDYLYIYATSQNELNSFIWTNHQLQYKEDGIDHNFVSLHSFIRNIINGDSTINYEVVHSNELNDTWIFWLNGLKNSFNTYTIAKSYNGLAQRDVKHYSKATNLYEAKKRLGHIIRGYIYAENIMNKTFNFEKANQMFIEEINKLEVDNQININTVDKYLFLLLKQRKILNDKFNNKTLGLPKNIGTQEAINLNSILAFYLSHRSFKDKQHILNGFDMKLFINAFENWVSYDKV